MKPASIFITLSSMLLIATTAATANARISDDLLRALPSPMNFLEKSNQAGRDLEKGLLSFLVSECPSLKNFPERFRDQGCEIPELSRQYSELVAKLQSGNNGVSSQSKPAVKTWDLSVLISGNFMFLPTDVSENEGRDLLIDLFVLRERILTAVETMYRHAVIVGPKPISPELIMLAPFMRAYFLTSTPLGALNEIFRSIQCKLNEPSCEIEKRIWGNVCNLAVELNGVAFADLEKRFTLIGNDETSPELARTKLIQVLADYIDDGHFDRDLLAAKLTELEGNGQGQSSGEDYAALTLSVLTYNEMKQLMSLKYNCLAYRDDLSEKTKASFSKRLSSMSKTSLDSIEGALRIFSVNRSQGTL